MKLFLIVLLAVLIILYILSILSAGSSEDEQLKGAGVGILLGGLLMIPICKLIDVLLNF